MSASLLIKNATLVDGTGHSPYLANLLVEGRRIARITPEEITDIPHVIDGQGLVLCPGIIDMHTHADFAVLDSAKHEIKIRQGVTSVIVGNCGFSAVPLSPGFEQETRRYQSMVMDAKDAPAYFTHEQYVNSLRETPLGLNVGLLCGHGTVRMAVKGFASGPLSFAEKQATQDYVTRAMQSGALGLSLGLMYAPENYVSREDILCALAPLKTYDGLLTAHIRGEGNTLLTSIQEVLSLAKEAGVRLHISHLKAAGKNNWQKALPMALAAMQEARDHGLQVTCDVYCYTAGSTLLSTLFPPWALEGGMTGLLRLLADAHERARIARDMASEQTSWDNIVHSTGWGAVRIASCHKAQNRPFVGKTIEEIAHLRGADPIQTACDLLTQEQDNLLIVFHHMCEQDMMRAIQWPHTAIASDSLYSAGLPHPRLYGNFPRLFANHVRTGQLRLESAVYKCTGLPAQILGLQDRGLLKEGARADLMLFDPQTITDKATYEHPQQYPQGISAVFLGGEPAWLNGKTHNNTRGELLLRV